MNDQQLTDIAAAALLQHHIQPGPLFLVSRSPPAHTPTVYFQADGDGHPITVNIDRDTEQVQLQTLLDSCSHWLSAKQRASLQAGIDEQTQKPLEGATHV
jgi:hypothetical protein